MSNIHYAPVTCNHWPPTYGGRMGDSWAKVQGNYFSCVLAGEITGFDTWILTPGRFSIAKGSAKSKVLTSSLPHRGGAHNRALKAEKSSF